MFRIRREQLDFFGDRTRENYVAKMSAWLLDAYPECVGKLSNAELSDWVLASTKKAESYGVVMETDVAQLMLLFMILGLDADVHHDWMRVTLSRKDLVGVGKMRKLVSDARARNVAGIESIALPSFSGASASEGTS
jgi:hypothetical protein